MTLCIIPARGGSKRIPRKNIKSFLGKPVIAYPVDAAWPVFDQVMVSTEDEEIAKIAGDCDAVVPFLRSVTTATDGAETEEVILEVLDRFALGGDKFRNCCVLYPCSVFATATHLRQAMAMLDDHDMVMSVVEYDYPIQRAVTLDPVRLVHPEMMERFFEKEYGLPFAGVLIEWELQ